MRSLGRLNAGKQGCLETGMLLSAYIPQPHLDPGTLDPLNPLLYESKKFSVLAFDRITMAILDIVTYPDMFLKQPTKPVENIDGSLQELIDNMGETMYQAPGIGLAAIQVGIDRSLLIYDISPQDEDRCMKVLVNPRIIENQGEVLSENEGCLSVPEYRSNVKRFASILVEAYDRDEKLLRFEAHDFLSIVLQHEIDHLNGKLFIDRISPLKRQLYTRRMQKQLKRGE